MRADRSFFADGAPLRLGDRLGKGGEGEVFALAEQPNLAAKIYHTDRAPGRRAKITVMIAAPLEAGGLVAAPSAIITDGTGAFSGFLMPRVADAAPLHDLYAPGSRREIFPDADYRFLLRVAANAARAVAAVHDAGHVIGDVNHSGFLISQDGLVALIDADSFQVRTDDAVHRCTVGVPEYTPPELQGSSLSEIDRTPAHDAFGLAVVVFQLLFFGRHPFSGVSETGHLTIPEAIAAGAFAFSATRSGPLTPPPGAMALTDLPAALADLFERAFGPTPEQRPSPRDWIEALSDAENAQRPCLDAVRHDYDLNAGACPLCRIENEGAAPLFPWRPPELTVTDVALPKAAADALNKARDQLTGLIPPTSLTLTLPSRPPPDGFQPPKRSRWPEIMRIVGGLLCIGISATNGIMIPNNWLLSVPGLLAGAALIRGGLKRDRAAQQDLLRIDSVLSRRLLDIQARADLDAAALAHARATSLINARAALPETFEASARERAENRLVDARQERMAATPASALTDDSRTVQKLTEAHVQTAADLLRAPLNQLPLAEGEQRALMAACREALDRVPVKTIVADALLAAAADTSAEMADKASSLDKRIAAELRELTRRMHTVELAARVADPEITDMVEQREKLVREVELVGGKPPAPPVPPPRFLRAATRQLVRELTIGSPPQP